MTFARAQIVAVGIGVPERRLGNIELAQSVPDTCPDWIASRTGIHERRICAPGQSLLSLAVPAARQCLAKAGVAPADLDGIVLASITADMVMPASANQLQHLLGASRAWGFDVINACNGFIAALTTATAFIESGHAKRILVVAGDVMSSIIDWKDRNTCVLFGDGCGAVLLEAGPADGPGIQGFTMHSDGGHSAELCVPSSGSAMPATPEALARGEHFLKQNGKLVFSHAVRRMAEVSLELMEQQRITAADIDLVVPHQANLRIITPTAERIGVPMDKVVVNLQHYGNTTAGTIPLALADAEADGRLKPGSRVMLVAFGGGLTWGAVYLTWGRA